MKKYHVRVMSFILSFSFILILLLNSSVYASSLHRSELSYNNSVASLEGEWLFFANQLYTEKEVIEHQADATVVNIPSSYNKLIKHTDGYGTFAIKVTIPQNYIGTIQAIRVPYQHAAMRIFIDDKAILNAGEIAKSEKDYVKMENDPVAYFQVEQNSFYVIVQFSSYGMLKSGFSIPLEIGEPHDIMKQQHKDINLVVFLLGILIVVGLFCTFIGLLDNHQRIMLIIGLFCLVVMIRCVFTAPFLYTEISLPFDINATGALRIEYVLSIMTGFLFMTYLLLLYKELFNRYIIKYNTALYILTGLVMLFVPSIQMQLVFTGFVAIQAVLIGYLIKILYIAYNRKLKYALTNFVCILILTSSLVFELLSAYNVIPPGPYVLLVFTVISVILAYEFGKFYVNQVKKLNVLNKQLFVMNNSLDELVQIRTDELVELNQKLQHQAIIDGLTGIYNRTYLIEKLEKYYKEAKDNNETLAVIIFDVDEFKLYNDTQGHLKGDNILVEIVKLVKQKLPDQTIFARYGGEEFVVLFKNYTAKEVQNYCEIIRNTIDKANIEHPSVALKRVTISLGGTFMQPHDHFEKAIDLLEKADKQLYVSKRTGKNRINI